MLRCGLIPRVDVPARWEPHPELAVMVQEHLPLRDYEGRYHEVSAGPLGAHTVPGYTSEYLKVDLVHAPSDIDVEDAGAVAVSVGYVRATVPVG